MKNDPECLSNIRNIYHSCNNNIIAISIIIKKYGGCDMPKDDLIWMDNCLHAALKKKNFRKKFDEKEKYKLWAKQGEKCALCNRLLDYNKIHIDHIIPWDFVGDELDDNYQVLCKGCNQRKSNHVSQRIKQLLLNNIA